MAKLKRYTNFEALKSNQQSINANQMNDNNFSAFETFLKRLQTAYSKEKKSKIDN